MIRAALAVAILCAPAAAQDRTPAQLLGSVIVLLAVGQVCDVTIAPEERRALAAAGEKLRRAAGLSDAQLGRLVSEIGQEAQRTNCLRARSGFRVQFRALMAEVERLG